MNGGLREIGLAAALEVVPASLFAASVGLAAWVAAGQPPAVAAPAGAAAFLLAWIGLRRVGADQPPIELPPFELADFEPSEMPAGEADELLLEDIYTGPAGDDDELLLEDIVSGPAAESRVIRLFEAQAIPTAGELRAKIDQHLECRERPVAPPDATRELHEALDALRRSLR